jgi:hypothetical protein
MLIDIELLDHSEALIIGGRTPTIKVCAKVDGVLSILPSKGHDDRCELTLVGLPKVVTAMESQDSLKRRVNDMYLAMAHSGIYSTLGRESSVH